MSKLFCLTFILCCFVSIFAQEKTIGKDEFDAMYNNALAKRASKSYRITITFQNSVEGKSEKPNSGTVVIEFAPPSMRRIVYQSNSEPQDKKRETIRINDKIYTKEGAANWKEVNPNNQQPANKSNVVESKTEYKFLGSEMLDNQKTNVYEKIEDRKRVNPADNKEIISNAVTKYWFGEDGELLKVEQAVELHIGGELLHNRLTKIYKFDPNIKIEAPQITNLEK
ncbi:MAG: hypothetical protein ACR2GD_05245 [Pyrinomonadaceae bacterium]